MAAELIGRCKCPLCGSDKARLSLAKSQLAVMTCNGCNCQLFARSDISDGRLRALLVAAAPAPEPAPAPGPEPKPAKTAAPAPEPAPPMPAPASTAPGWGFFGARP